MARTAWKFTFNSPRVADPGPYPWELTVGAFKVSASDYSERKALRRAKRFYKRTAKIARALGQPFPPA